MKNSKKKEVESFAINRFFEPLANIYYLIFILDLGVSVLLARYSLGDV